MRIKYSETPLKPNSEVMKWIDTSWGLCENGNLIWIRDGKKVKKNDPVYCCLLSNGYSRVCTSTKPRKTILAHHIIWYLHYGEWPNKSIDHIDRNKSNNCIDNLRLATRSQNHANIGPIKGKYKGVYPLRNKWVAQVARKYLGVYSTQEEARLVAIEYGKKIYGEYYL